MSKSLILPVLMLLTLSCGREKPSTYSENIEELNIDSINREKLKYTVITDTQETKSVTNGVKPRWSPNQAQLDSIKFFIKHTVAKNQHEYSRHLVVDSLDNVYKQYVCYIDEHGDTLVYINGSCLEREILYEDSVGNLRYKKYDWQNKLFGDVLDGGDCFWKMKINYSKKELVYLYVNEKT